MCDVLVFTAQTQKTEASEELIAGLAPLDANISLNIRLIHSLGSQRVKKGSGDWWERLVITEVNDYYGLYISTPCFSFFLLMRHLAEAELRLRNARKMRPTCLTAGLALIIISTSTNYCQQGITDTA